MIFLKVVPGTISAIFVVRFSNFHRLKKKEVCSTFYIQSRKKLEFACQKTNLYSSKACIFFQKQSSILALNNWRPPEQCGAGNLYLCEIF